MDFIGKRKIAYAFSATLIIVGLIFFLINGLNFGIDFSGGSLMQVRFDQTSVTTADVRNVLTQYNLASSSIQESGAGNFVIKTIELDEATQRQIIESFEGSLGTVELMRSEKVGPVIGNELRRAALIALVLAALLQIIYITIRFEFKSAMAAILALLHDAFITLAFFSIFQFEVDSAFIAAILTIIGYSINDTIVIFDRIRENMKNRRKEDLGLIVNNSINQTLARSINTVLTTILVVIALLFLGGDTTKTFALALLIGIISGAYSSIFIASPLWYEFKAEKPQKAH